MKREITIESIESTFDGLFEEISKLNDDMMTANYVSLKQVYEAYEESRQ